MADVIVAQPGQHVVTFIASDPAPVSGKVWPMLGAVTADVTGLLDADGTITGTVNTLITNPVHVARAMLRFGFDFGDIWFNKASWQLAADRAAAFGYTWVCQFLPMSFADFQTAVFTQSRVNIFAENGEWRAVFREPAASMGILTEDRIVSLSLGWTSVKGVVAELHMTYGAGVLQQGVVTRTSIRGEMVAPGQTADIALPWVADRAMAESLADWWLRIHDHQRRQVGVVFHPSGIALIRMDTIQIDHRLLDPYGGVALLWKVSAIRMRPDGFTEILAEEEDGADVIALVGLITAGGGATGVLTALGPTLTGAPRGTAVMSGALTIGLMLGVVSASGVAVGALTGGTAIALFAGTSVATAVSVGALSTTKQLAGTATAGASLIAALAGQEFTGVITATGILTGNLMSEFDDAFLLVVQRGR